MWTVSGTALGHPLRQRECLRRPLCGRQDARPLGLSLHQRECQRGSYVDGKRHGRWVIRYASGSRLEFDYRNGSYEGQSGVYITESGKRYPGRVTGDGKCFRDSDGYAWVAWAHGTIAPTTRR